MALSLVFDDYSLQYLLVISNHIVSFTVPPNGLVVYCGTIVTEEGKEKKVNIDFEPFKPINTSLYLCDNKFHTEVRNPLLPADPSQTASLKQSLVYLSPQPRTAASMKTSCWCSRWRLAGIQKCVIFGKGPEI